MASSPNAMDWSPTVVQHYNPQTMTPIRKRTFEQFRHSQEDAVIQGREQPTELTQPAQPESVEEPAVVPAPVGIRRWISNTLDFGKNIYNWIAAKTVGEHTIEMPAEGRIEEQNNKRRFVVPGAWPQTPSPRRRQTPRGQTPRAQTPRLVEPASPSPAPRRMPEGATVEVQVQLEAVDDIETTPATVTPEPIAEEPRSEPEALVFEDTAVVERKSRRKSAREEPRRSITKALGVISANSPKKSRKIGKPLQVGILRKHLAARTLQEKKEEQRKVSRRVHFGEEGQIFQYCKPFPTKIKEYDIGGICGEAPSPLNRRSFQDMRADGPAASPARSDVSTPDRRPNQPATLSPALKKPAASVIKENEDNIKHIALWTTSLKNEEGNIKSYDNEYENNEHKIEDDKNDTQAHDNNMNNDEHNDMNEYQSNDTRMNSKDGMNESIDSKNDTNNDIKSDTETKTENYEIKEEKTLNISESDAENVSKSYVQRLKGRLKQEVEPPVTPTTRSIEELVDRYELFGLSARTRRVRQERREAARRKAEEEAAAERRRIEEEAAAERRRIEEEQKRIEEERRKQEAEERKKRSIVIDISDDWKNKLEKTMAVQNMSKDIVPNLTRKDFGTLLPQNRAEGIGWLNDEIVNGYLNAIVAKALKITKYNKAADEIPKYHAFNTNLYSNYILKGYQSVQRWPTRAKIGGKRLLGVEKVLIPVNNHSHWTLICISGTKRTIEYYDSLYDNPGKYTAFALEFVKNVLGEHFVADEWSILDASSAQQANGVDCGVFVCMNALALAMGRDPTTAFSARDAQAARRLIGATLLNGGLSGEFEISID